MGLANGLNRIGKLADQYEQILVGCIMSLIEPGLLAGSIPPKLNLFSYSNESSGLG